MKILPEAAHNRSKPRRGNPRRGAMARHPIMEALTRVQVVTNEEGKEGVIVVLKAASRAMVQDYKRIRWEIMGEPLPPKLHIFVRDPIQRLKSAYQFFNGRPPVHAPHRNLTWEEFVDAVLDGAENPHWRSAQETIDLLPGAQGRVTVHRFEDLATEFPLGPLVKKNESTPIDVDLTYREQELKDFYAADYALRGE